MHEALSLARSSNEYAVLIAAQGENSRLVCCTVNCGKGRNDHEKSSYFCKMFPKYGGAPSVAFMPIAQVRLVMRFCCCACVSDVEREVELFLPQRISNASRFFASTHNQELAVYKLSNWSVASVFLRWRTGTSRPFENMYVFEEYWLWSILHLWRIYGGGICAVTNVMFHWTGLQSSPALCLTSDTVSGRAAMKNQAYFTSLAVPRRESIDFDCGDPWIDVLEAVGFPGGDVVLCSCSDNCDKLHLRIAEFLGCLRFSRKFMR